MSLSTQMMEKKVLAFDEMALNTRLRYDKKYVSGIRDWWPRTATNN